MRLRRARVAEMEWEWEEAGARSSRRVLAEPRQSGFFIAEKPDCEATTVHFFNEPHGEDRILLDSG